jgi:hypothetical protein
MPKQVFAMANKAKWIEKTVNAIREDCNRKEGMVVGYSLCFFDPMQPANEGEYQWVIRLGFDPRSPLPQEQKDRLEKALDLVMRSVAQIFQVESHDEEEALADYMKKAKFH